MIFRCILPRFDVLSLHLGVWEGGGSVEMSCEWGLPPYVGIHDEYYIRGKVLPTISSW